jgi:hypothetical protein
LLKQAQVRGPVLAAIAEIAQLTVRRGNGPSAIPLDSAVATLDHLLGVGNGELLVDHLFAVGILRKIDRVGDQTIVFVIDSFAEVLAAHFIVQNCTEGAPLEKMLREHADNTTAAAPSARQTLDHVAQLRSLASQLETGASQGVA